MSQPGTVFTAEGAAQYLQEYNKNYSQERNWLRDFYGSMATPIDINAQRTENMLTEEYSANIADAYRTAMLQNQGILASNLGEGFKNEAIANTDLALEQAYDAHLRNYLSEKQELQSNTASALNPIYAAQSDAIEELNKRMLLQSENTAKYLNAHFDYLTKLYEKDETIFDREDYRDFANWDFEEGVISRTGLKDISEIRAMMFDENNVLTDSGKDFIKMIQSTDAINDFYSFGDYLYDTDSELWEWAQGYDNYNTEYSDSVGNKTNRAYALGIAGLSENGIVNTDYISKNTSNDSDFYVEPKKSVSNSKDFGNINYYESGDYGSIATLDSLTLKGASKIRDKNNDNFRVEFTGDSTQRTYRLEIVSDKEEGAIADDEMLLEIDKSVGGIKNNQLYFIGDELWVGFVFEDGSKKLRKVQGQGDQRNYKNMIATLQNPTELAKKASK